MLESVDRRGVVGKRDYAILLLLVTYGLRAREIAALIGDRQPAAFGTQSRSYVLHPYQLVADRRCGHRTANADSVLNGHLDEFMEAWLKWNLRGSQPPAQIRPPAPHSA